MVRNIGNQMATAEGSVEYGVHHLHTPLLIFVGHSSCGAIKAASGNYAKESRAIRRELDSIRIAKGVANMDGVRSNVNNQVAAALKKFRHEVKEGKLTVIGAVYDFANDFGQGFGKLNVINLNGEADSARIKASKLLAGVNMAEKSMAGKDATPSDGEVPQPNGVNAKPAAYSYP
jgi:carbonic anhydrase